MIVFACPQCGAQVNATDEEVAQKITCTHCQHQAVVPDVMAEERTLSIDAVKAMAKQS